MENYEKVKSIVNESNCILLTDFEEIERRRDNVLNKSYYYVRIDFIGSCGHNTSAVFTNFKTRKTGIICKDCVKIYCSNVLKNKEKETNEVELESIKIIEEYLNGYYEVKRTKEGCRADLAIKEIGNNYDNWIPVQVKCTDKTCHNMYSFRKLISEYKDMLLLCICNSERKIWVIPYNDLDNTLKTLNISRISKYNKYLCTDNAKLYSCIDLYKNKCMRRQLDICLLPVSELQQREQEYIKKRERYVTFLDYKYIEIQNTPTDFIVNGKKVQEKVAGLNINRGRRRIIITMGSNNGKKEDGSRNFRTYRLGENDYYWIHSSVDDRFWIIPEYVLFEKGYISKEDETIHKKAISISNSTEWIKEYQYNYNDINREKIEKIFK
jgi:hypothetical protein